MRKYQVHCRDEPDDDITDCESFKSKSRSKHCKQKNNSVTKIFK